MLIIEITKIELTGGHIGMMLIIQMERIEFPGKFKIGYLYK